MLVDAVRAGVREQQHSETVRLARRYVEQLYEVMREKATHIIAILAADLQRTHSVPVARFLVSLQPQCCSFQFPLCTGRAVDK